MGFRVCRERLSEEKLYIRWVHFHIKNSSLVIIKNILLIQMLPRAYLYLGGFPGVPETQNFDLQQELAQTTLIEHWLPLLKTPFEKS